MTANVAGNATGSPRNAYSDQEQSPVVERLAEQEPVTEAAHHYGEEYGRLSREPGFCAVRLTEASPSYG
jgi:hypothetical protein